MTLQQENAVFEKLQELGERFAIIKSAEALTYVRIAVQSLRRQVAELEYGGVISLRKISIEPSSDLGADFNADFAALKATLYQKGLRWC